jgi:dTDP-4-amino-4,6-dideoxygalactose transaminase
VRAQPPAHSPLTARALLAGARGAAGMRDDTRRLRELVRRDWGAHDVLLTDSGTTALALALAGAAAGHPGAPVALPAYGCFDLATAADAAGAPVVLFDVDPATLSPNRASLERALAHAPCAVVVVHLFGIPVDAAALGDVGGALRVEDAAQGAGTAVRGRPAGSAGSVAVLSFGRGKGVTGGGGGALLGNDARGAAVVRRASGSVGAPVAGWRALAGAAAQWALARPAAYALPAALPFLRLGETAYHPPRPPRALPDGAASVLCEVWELARREAAVRATHAARLTRAVRAAGGTTPRIADDASAGFLRLPVLPPPGADAAAARLLGAARGYPLALCDLPGFGERCINPHDPFPGARLLAERLVTLPTHSLLEARDLEALEEWIEGWGREGVGWREVAVV